MADGDEGLVVDAGVVAGLLAEAQDHVAPLRIVARPVNDRFAADLVAADGRVAVAEYGSGPDELIAVLVAEQAAGPAWADDGRNATTLARPVARTTVATAPMTMIRLIALTSHCLRWAPMR